MAAQLPTNASSGIKMVAQLAGLILLAAIIQARAAPVTQYNFTRETCLEGVSENVGTGGADYFGKMVLNTSLFECLEGSGLKGNGMEGPAWPIASSTGNVSALRTEIRSQKNSDWPGLSFELWVSLGDPQCYQASSTHGCQIALLSIGTDPDDSDYCGYSTEFELSYDGIDGLLTLRVVENPSLPSVASCLAFTCTYQFDPSDYPFHLVLTIGETTRYSDTYIVLRWYLNGTQVSYYWTPNITPQLMVKQWTDSYQLHLLGRRRLEEDVWEQTTYWPFEGRLFGAAIYVEELSANRILAIFNDGIVDSTPVVNDIVVEIPEDGERGHHYDTPQYYLQEIPGDELYGIDIGAGLYDADNDPFNPNYPKDYAVPRILVATMPLTGDLFNSSGDLMLSAPFEVDEVNGTHTVRYRPLLNDASTSDTGYVNITFYAEDGRLGSRSVTNATLTVRVYAKNDPPEAFNDSQLVYAGTNENIIHFDATDVDEGDFVAGALISVLPARGKLYQVFDNGSASDTIVAEWDALWSQAIGYRFDNLELQSNEPEQEIVGNDSFGFVVFDSDSNNSLPAFVNITVLAGVWALPYDGLWPCFEDTDCDVYLYGIAKAEGKVEMSFTLSKVPDYGQVIDDGTSSRVEDGSMLSVTDTSPWSDGVNIIYRPTLDFFTTPQVTWNGTELPDQPENITIRFFVSAYLGDVVMSSPIVEQTLRVMNVNDDSNLTCAGLQHYSVNAIGWSFDDLNGTIARPDEAVFTNISITERDRAVDAIRVDIEIDTGFVSFDELHLPLLDFSRDCDNWENVRCQGDGSIDTNPIFSGEPKDVELALNSAVYQSYARNYVDNVSIIIYDGRGGDCLGSFRTTSSRPSCARSNCSIQIEVGDYYYPDDDDDEALVTVSWYWALVVFVLLSACIVQLSFWTMKKILLVSKSSILLCFRVRKHGWRKGWRIQPTPTIGDGPAAQEHLRPPATQEKRSTSSSPRPLRRSLFHLGRRRVAAARPYRQGPVVQAVLSSSSRRVPSRNPGPASSWVDD